MTESTTPAPATQEARVDALRAYWRATAEADELETAAWKEPTPESAFAALLARKAQNAAYVHMNRTRTATPAKATAAPKKRAA